MMWAEPSLLWLLLPLALATMGLFVVQRRRRDATSSFADPALVTRLAGDVAPARRALRLALRVAALALLVVALAGPKYGFRWEQVRRQGIDLIVAVDTSRSMLATDVVPNRLERAKLAVLDLLGHLHGDRIGLVAFAGTAFLETPLTLDYSAFARSLRALHVGIIPRGGTSLSRAIDTSLEAFEARQGKYEVLILITDGEENEGEALVAAERAAERGVRIFTVGIGTPEGELLPLADAGGGFVKDRKGQVVKSRLNETLLREVAIKTGGAYVRGLGPQLGLDQVFDDYIAKLERRDVESGLERRFEERFQMPLLLALILLWIEALVGERARSRPRPVQWLRRRRMAVVPAVLLSIGLYDPASAAWYDRREDPINQGVDHYRAGDYASAVAVFGEALVESPASPQLQFNLAASLHRDGRDDEAAAALEKVVASGDATWVGKANYNLGNVYFSMGAAAENESPQVALERWSQALLAYRRALGADPANDDARFNHELTQRRIDALRERLEKERQEQEQPPPEEDGDAGDEEQPQDEQPQDGEDSGEPQPQDGEDSGEPQPQDGEDSGEPQPQDGEDSDEPQPQDDGGESADGGEEQQPTGDDAPDTGDDDAAAQPPPGDAGGEESAGESPPAEGGASDSAAAEEPDGGLEQAARAVLDIARDEELSPQEIRRDLGVVGIGDALQDW